MFKIQAAEAANLRVFVGMVKGDAELKLFHYIRGHSPIFFYFWEKIDLKNL